jgi:hypothetical protein
MIIELACSRRIQAGATAATGPPPWDATARKPYRNSEKAVSVLQQEYRKEITLDEAIALSVQALKEASENDLSAVGMNIAVVTKESKKFRTLSVEEIRKYL